jgi:hypothetical protein
MAELMQEVEVKLEAGGGLFFRGQAGADAFPYTLHIQLLQNISIQVLANSYQLVFLFIF